MFLTCCPSPSVLLGYPLCCIVLLSFWVTVLLYCLTVLLCCLSLCLTACMGHRLTVPLCYCMSIVLLSLSLTVHWVTVLLSLCLTVHRLTVPLSYCTTGSPSYCSIYWVTVLLSYWFTVLLSYWFTVLLSYWVAVLLSLCPLTYTTLIAIPLKMISFLLMCHELKRKNEKSACHLYTVDFYLKLVSTHTHKKQLNIMKVEEGG